MCVVIMLLCSKNDAIYVGGRRIGVMKEEKGRGLSLGRGRRLGAWLTNENENETSEKGNQSIESRYMMLCLCYEAVGDFPPYNR